MNRDWYDFKALNSNLAGARESFADACETLLRKRFPQKEVRQVKPHPGDDGIDIYIGEIGTEQISVYQCKFFLEVIGKSQKDQISESFNRSRTSKNYEMKEWVLCLPRQLALEESRWWTAWKARRMNEFGLSAEFIKLITGNELIDQMKEAGVYDLVFQMQDSINISKILDHVKGSSEGMVKGIAARLPSLTEYFTGRDRVLAGISKTLGRYGRAALFGMFGIGKTSAAVRFLQDVNNEYQRTYFITASNEQFLHQLAALAETVDPLAASRLKGLQEKAFFFRDCLADELRWKGRGKWLLVMDNVDDVGRIREFVPSGRVGDVLFTSNFANISSLARLVEIKEFNTNEGSSLLYRRSTNRPGKSTSRVPSKLRPMLAKIVTELGGSPLAINIAGSVIGSTRMAYEAYYDLIQSDGSALVLEAGDASDPYQNHTIWRAFEISYDLTRKPDSDTRDAHLIAEAAIHILHASAAVSAEAIPEDFLRAYVQKQGQAFSELVKKNAMWVLAKEKATRLDLLRFDPRNGTFWTHRLIQRILYELVGR